jgi:hypothetical protein
LQAQPPPWLSVLSRGVEPASEWAMTQANHAFAARQAVARSRVDDYQRRINKEVPNVDSGQLSEW